MTTTSLDDQIAMVVRQLAASLDIPVPRIEDEVRRAFGAWRHATIQDFVPIFVEREVRGRLSETQ